MLHQAWEADTYAEARRGLHQIKDELDKTCPKAAASLAEGLEDTLSLHKLGLGKALRDRLKTSNIIENLNSVVAYRSRNVKRWMSSDQRHRWCASIFMQYEHNLTAIDESLIKELRQALTRIQH